MVIINRLKRKKGLSKSIKISMAGIRLRFNENGFEKEIYNSCLTLKNLSYTNRDMPLSCDFILEELMKNSKLIKDIYAEMLSLYRSGYDEEAFSVMYKKVPLKTAKNFSMILSKIDKINPNEMISYMTSFEKTLSESRLTKGIKRTEKRSFLITTLATICVFAVLINFVAVVVFTGAIDMMGAIF